MWLNKSLRHQSGITTVEFALIGSVLFVVLFGLIEFGRLLFTWNVLDEATRRAVRVAVVCPITAVGQQFARETGAFGGTLLPDFTEANIVLSYLQEDGITLAAATEDTYYVRARIATLADETAGLGTVYEHQMLIPFFNITLDADAFETTLPTESLGVHPDGAGSAPCGP
ncbi:TadE/TadG family type IV pilus assembly protein [Marinobacterium stanieri]|uniref:TadE/TadG family type IV pilus assembly protein n=1 Tax=Marinobacterium stanieri TaxID=49186 RepID=UPI000255A859|nr:TadE family protein [Marinobacterium stanieri]